MQVANVEAVRRRLADQGPPWVRDISGDFEQITVPERDCDRIRDLLIAEEAETVVEIGLAYGSSALAIGAALVSGGTNDPRHIVVDPFQETVWSNVGWRLLQDAGLEPILALELEPSSVVLPRLVTEGLVADAAFVDGSHRFHEVMVDLYFLRKIVRPGGLIILDDQWWPSVRTAIRYYELNLGWHIIPDAFEGCTRDRETGTYRGLAVRLPDPSYEPRFDQFVSFGS